MFPAPPLVGLSTGLLLRRSSTFAEDLGKWLTTTTVGNVTIGIVAGVFFFIFCGCFCLIWSNHEHLSKSNEKEQLGVLERLTSHFEIRSQDDFTPTAPTAGVAPSVVVPVAPPGGGRGSDDFAHRSSSGGAAGAHRNPLRG